MNLSQLGLSAMNAATARLMTAGHNINNADTAGYNRQNVVLSTAGGVAAGQGFFGRGVQVDTVRRSYNAFLSNQFVSAQSKGAMLAAYGAQVGQINNLIADNTVGLSPAIQKFFDGIQAVASAPADPAARQELFGRAQSMVGQFNEMNAFLNKQRQDINDQVQTIVTKINSHVQRVAEFNKQITLAKGTTGQIPNDLLDQRDQEVAELNVLVDIQVLEQDDQFSLTIGHGQWLLSGGVPHKLSAGPSTTDPRTLTVYTTMPSGQGGQLEVAMDESAIEGGTLGGLLMFRRQSLDQVQRQLGQLANGMALAINAVQTAGVDMNGETGATFFQIGQPDALAHSGNKGSGVLAAAINLNGASDLRAAEYDIRFDGTNYIVTRQPDNEQVFAGDPLTDVRFDGMTVSMTGAPAAGDRWALLPARDAAGKLQMVLTGPDKLAAASSSGGSANGDNMLAMAQLQTANTLAGATMSFSGAYSQIVNSIATQTQHNGAQAKAQAALIEQTYAAQQAVSGVNLDEEYVNLDRFQEQYLAASRLIEISATLFESLMGIRA